MHSFQLRRFLVVAIAATLFLVAPAEARKRRSVGKTPSASTTVDISGTVIDNATGQPVIGATVRAAQVTRITDQEGKFSFRNLNATGAITVEATRTGYNPGSAQVASGGAQNITIRLNSLPTVTLRRADNSVVDLDVDSIEFGFPLVFSGYQSAPFEDFCRPDGTLVEVDRSEIAKINGPATVGAYAPCCPNAETMKINITLKNGTTSDFYFVDACNGNMNIEIIGREHRTAQKLFIPVTQIREVVFP